MLSYKNYNNYQQQSDETLVLLTLAGEQYAYEMLVKRYQKLAVNSAATITKNHFMAEDAAQDAFVTAWMKLNTLQNPKKYGAWVCRIAKNCALNMLNRYRSFIPIDLVDNLDVTADTSINPEEIYVSSKENENVNKSIERLPEKVRQIIYLHYFENLSIVEIAERMCISEGTVKWQLHDGRKRIRKELCAMDEKYNDTLVTRVMKKVEELKLWQIKNDKTGFENVYREVLREVEELPESNKKQHALADVLMRGWWWLPGKKNDALFERIKNAAIEGKNEEVMTFVTTREDSLVNWNCRIEFIRDKQIPRLEKYGFIKSLGREWYWLGYYYFRNGKKEDGISAFKKAEEILPKDDLCRVLVPYVIEAEEKLKTKYKNFDYEHYDSERFSLKAFAEEYRYIDGRLCRWNEEAYEEGYVPSVDNEVMHIFSNASRCDGHFFADISVGQTYCGTDESSLTFDSDNQTVSTPAGVFEGCQLWVTRHWDFVGREVFRTYYKPGVGIVKHERTHADITEAYYLKSYNIVGGEGPLPICASNSWEYSSQHDPANVECELKYEISYADSDKVVVAHTVDIFRKEYDQNSWTDMISKVKTEYCNEKQELQNVYPAIERAEELAKTRMEKVHTKLAASATRRILSTDPKFNPHHTHTGHWNFFHKNTVRRKKDTICYLTIDRHHIEWKTTYDDGYAEDAVLFNDIYGILQGAANCLWSDEWRVGASPVIEYTEFSHDIKTEITCVDGGTITTKAGTFENCLKLCLNIGGLDGGHAYRGGNKAYYFAPGIGIVRAENNINNSSLVAVYDLTAYEGVGGGYMPLADGMTRRYDLVNATDGYIASAEYFYVADQEGDINIFADRTGIRQVIPPVTQYSAIQGEIIEEQLCDQRKWGEGQTMYGVNNFHLILHLLARSSHNINDAKRSIEIHGFNMDIIHSLGENGEVPPAWYNLYSWTALIRSAAYFGNGDKEEGYRMLETAFEYHEKAHNFKDGELLDTGKFYVTGGVKYVNNRGIIKLQDGSTQPVNYIFRMNHWDEMLFEVLSSPSGWEWFNSARDDERFLQYIERSKKFINNL